MGRHFPVKEKSGNFVGPEKWEPCTLPPKNKRLHSSRMHTARLLTVSPSMHCAGGVSLPGGSPCWGGALPGGLPCQGGIPACTETDPPPCGQNSWHVTEILPCPKLCLRAVIKEMGRCYDTKSPKTFFLLLPKTPDSGVKKRPVMR